MEPSEEAMMRECTFRCDCGMVTTDADVSPLSKPLQCPYSYRVGDIVQILRNGDIGTVVGLMIDEHDNEWAHVQCKVAQSDIPNETFWYGMDAIDKVPDERLAETILGPPT